MDQVSKIFNEAKKSKFGYKKIADQIGMLFSDNKLILEELLNNLFYIAEADGNISINEIEVLKSISQSFHLSEKDFQRIFTFENYMRSKKLAINHHNDNGFAHKGMYIKCYIKNFPIDKLVNHGDKALIVSTLLNHERKMTLLHMRV